MENILPQVGQVVEFDAFSIILLIIIIVSIIIGAVRGLIGSIISFISSFGSIFFASLFSESVGNLLYSTDFSKIIYDPIFSWVSSQGEGLLNQTVTQETQNLVLKEALTTLDIPEILQEVLLEIIPSFIPETGGNLACIISESLAVYACTAISFLVLWLVIFIVFKLLDAFAKQFNEIPVIGGFNRFLGGLIGLGVGLCICCLICYVVSLFASFDIQFANDILLSMKLDDSTVWTFSKVMYSNNFIVAFIEMFK